MQIVSQAEASGQIAVQELAAIQGQTFDTPQVLISNNMGGMEDIPVSLPGLILSCCPNAIAAITREQQTNKPVKCCQ